MKILVTGATGTVGSAVVKELQQRGASLRVLVRNQSKRVPDNVEVAIGDLADPVAVEKAIEGVDKLYLFERGCSR